MKDMTGKQWLESFKKHYDLNILAYEKSIEGQKDNPSVWTKHIIGTVVQSVGDELKCYVVRQGKKTVKESGEYLHIDALFLDGSIKPILHNEKSTYDDPRILPVAAVEHENSSDLDKISFCLWKLLCVRTRKTRVLICYQSNSENIEKKLMPHLEKVILKGKLMKGEDVDLLVIVGNEKNDDYAQPFEKYYSVFQWIRDRFEEIQ
jgi:hypothetical protein